LDDTNLGGNQADIIGMTMVKAIWRRTFLEQLSKEILEENCGELIP
jgi:hypothetical protein